MKSLKTSGSIVIRGVMFLLCWLMSVAPGIAQQQAPPAKTVESVTAEMNRAIQRVKYIVNQPVTPIRRTPGMRVATYAMWFHPGAHKPDFSAVDIRKTQETGLYDKFEYVALDSDPNFVYPGKQLEFNLMTKYFYTGRSVPKKKLSESEMLAVNQLYRTIGRCENDLEVLRGSAPDAAPASMAGSKFGVEEALSVVAFLQVNRNYLIAFLILMVMAGVFGALRKKTH
jgi:hypothetical protein